MRIAYLLAVICFWQLNCVAAEARSASHKDGLTLAECNEMYSKKKDFMEVFDIVTDEYETITRRNKDFHKLLRNPEVGPEALAPYADMVHILSRDGSTPLYSVISSEQSEKQGAKMQWLVDRGADVDHGGFGIEAGAPLHTAAKNKNTSAVRILLDAGVDTCRYIKMQNYYNTYDRANNEYHPDITKMIQEEEIYRRRWSGRDGLRQAWFKVSVGVAIGASAVVGAAKAEKLE